MKEQLCEEIIKWRHQNRKSQTEISEELGVSQSTLHKWESCKCAIPVKYYLKISKLIEKNLKDFIPEDLQVFVPDFSEKKIEAIHFSAMEMLNVLEENNQLLKEKVSFLEKQIESLQNSKTTRVRLG
ncbi:MAG: transcriptional regulator with XRE-family HTH domain [Arcticibacterium sp.]|jgi:transcriptional regulator with XRE-family HTH domain